MVVVKCDVNRRKDEGRAAPCSQFSRSLSIKVSLNYRTSSGSSLSDSPIIVFCGELEDLPSPHPVHTTNENTCRGVLSVDNY